MDRIFWISSSRKETWRKFRTCLMLQIATLMFLDQFQLFNAQQNNICLSKACIHKASDLLSNMNFTVNPCEDFYEFVCGSFLSSTEIPDDKGSVTEFNMVSEILEKQLKHVLEKPIKDDEPRTFVLAKKYYKACMNKKAIERRGVEPVQEFISALGGWPVVLGKCWKRDNFSWKQAVYTCAKIGCATNELIGVTIGTDMKNSNRRVLKVTAPTFGIPKEYLLTEKISRYTKAYYKYMIDVAVIFGANRSRAEHEFKNVIIFERSLARITLSKEKRRNLTLLYNPTTVKEMQLDYPTVPWLEYLNHLLAPYLQIDEDEQIIVEEPKFLECFQKLMDRTPKRTIANYMVWRVIESLCHYLGEKIKRATLKYHSVLLGTKTQDPRWKQCVTRVTYLDAAVGALYVRNYFQKEYKKNMEEMVYSIREQFTFQLKQLDWMDAKTKKNALTKAAAMQQAIAYPNELEDDNVLDEYYKNLDIDDNYFLESGLNINTFGEYKVIELLRKPINKSDWTLYSQAAIVNAFYAPSTNYILFPAGILQGVFFSHGLPKYMNYGAIGGIVGHEITHGFDDKGRQFNQDGNLEEWWEPATKEAFLKKTRCIINQYSAYKDADTKLNLNGVATQGENIADNGGVKTAYNAYKNWHKKNSPEQQLPGLTFSPQQMFWISAASVWCQKLRPEIMNLGIKTGVHSPGRFRVKGPFSNREEFAADFRCPLGSPMNPKHKCQVW